ncbi:unnamed protein product, partial [Candidula unifasciata]
TLGCIYHDYCVVGAGPGGLQVGYFLQSSGRDYIVFERSNKSGSFFELYPRHRKLISINKRNTGKKNIEFNLRHDWNSLLSHDESLKVTKYSRELFPNAEILLDYLNDFQHKLSINVQLNTNIENIHKVPNATAPDGHVFQMNDQRNQCYTCRTLIMATGISTPNIPQVQGIELAKGYESVSINPEDYEAKTVLILGRGNAAFEFADAIYGSSNLIHMISRSRVRLSWATHYVGDLRAVNNGLLDTYQLKSLDGLMEGSLSKAVFTQKGKKIYLTPHPSVAKAYDVDNFSLREPYDVVIRALGFKFDDTVFNNTVITRGKARAKKYPAIDYNYESVDLKGLFYAGTASHSLDFRKSAGGFIHGFRYTARALHRLLEWRYEGVVWPSVTFPRSQLINIILKRINEASGIYQMFQCLGDVAVLSSDQKTVTYIEDFPINLLHQFPQHTGIDATSVLVLVMEYGRNFSGPGNDIFRAGRATGEPAEAHASNFLHPVVYYYSSLPTEKMMRMKRSKDTLPRPDKVHHIVEDFHTHWNAVLSHVLPLRRFLEEVWQTDLRTFFSQVCFQLVMMYDNVPEYCSEHYLNDQGFYGTSQMVQVAASHGLVDAL